MQLSKDALNQLDQTSLTQNQELQSKQRQQPKREQTQNSVNGSSPSQTARDDGLKIYYPESDSRHVPLPKRAEKGESWQAECQWQMP